VSSFLSWSSCPWFSTIIVRKSGIGAVPMPLYVTCRRRHVGFDEGCVAFRARRRFGCGVEGLAPILSGPEHRNAVAGAVFRLTPAREDGDYTQRVW
jgi:hypothetical protein